MFPASSVLSVYDQNDDAKLIFTLNGHDSHVADYLTSNGVDPQAYVAQAAKVTVDALKAIEDENITMNFNTSISPCVLKPITGESYEYLVLPVRITNN